jgi:hypothetical protein
MFRHAIASWMALDHVGDPKSERVRRDADQLADLDQGWNRSLLLKTAVAIPT